MRIFTSFANQTHLSATCPLHYCPYTTILKYFEGDYEDIVEIDRLAGGLYSYWQMMDAILRQYVKRYDQKCGVGVNRGSVGLDAW